MSESAARAWDVAEEPTAEPHLHLVPEPEPATENEIKPQIVLSAEERAQLKLSDPFKAFMIEAERYPLLTAQQEVVLGRKVQRGLDAVERLQDVDLELSHDQCQEDLQLFEKGEAAKRQFITSNLRLVAKISSKYFFGHPVGEAYGKIDLYNEGFKGLDRAVDMFDPEKGFKFSTYATNWIKHFIERALDNNGTTIRISTENQGQMRNLARLEGQAASEDKILDELDVTPQQLADIRNMRKAAYELTSLDKPIVTDQYGSTNATFKDMVIDPKAEETMELLTEPPDSGAFLDEKQAQTYEFGRFLVEIFNDEGDTEILNAILAGENLGNTRNRRKHRMLGLLEHPAVRFKLAAFKPDSAEAGTDWRDEAACKEENMKIFTSGEEQKAAEVAAICASCVVRKECGDYFTEVKPERGLWRDGQKFKTKKRERNKRQPARKQAKAKA